MKKLQVKLALPLILILLCTALLPLTVNAVTYTSYENYTTGDDAAGLVFTGNWSVQTFTTNATLPGTSHTINTIRLKLYQLGEAGTLAVGIRATNSSGAPIGLDLSSGTLGGDTITTDAGGIWYDIEVDEITLAANTSYAIVSRGTGANATNTLGWRYNSTGATYSGGNRWSSIDGGVTWVSDAGADYVFEVFGTPAMEVHGANVYEGYLYDGDWLVVVSYKNIFEPYYTGGSSRDSFYVQLTNADNTLIAQTPMPEWGYKPGALYLSNTTVSALEWGALYKVALSSVESPHYNETYTLTSGDWRGTGLILLDDWCLTVANSMGDYYGVDLVIETASKGFVLNEQGGVMFLNGIPYLDKIRPGLFMIATEGIDYTDPTWTGNYESGLDEWDAAVGAQLTGIFNDAGDMVNLSGKNIGIMLIFLLYAGIATSAFVIGHGTAGMALALPVLIVGVYFGFIPFAAMGVAIAVTVILLARQLWWSQT